MKRFIAVALILALVAGAAFAQSKAVYDTKAKAYKIEPGAKLRVGVDNDKWGAAIVALWDKLHPEAKGMVEFVNFGAAGGSDQITALQGEAPDVCLVIDGEVSRNAQSLMALDKVIVSAAKSFAMEPFYSSANSGVPKFIPVNYDGMAFAWNADMMTALGLNTKDGNKDGLPDAFDTWEEIFALSKSWAAKRPTYKGKTVNIVFPMSLDEVWSGYSSLTAGGWKIFAEGDGTKPGFEKKAFATGLSFIKAAADAKISVEATGTLTPGASMTWRWDDALNNETAPFFLVGTWMDITGAETKGGYDIKFGPLPTWAKTRLSPFVKTKGWVINGFTKYPSAAHELYRILFLKDGLQAMVDNSAYIPALKAKSFNTPAYTDSNKAEMSKAFAFNYPEPAIVLPGNKAKKAMDGYYGIGINLIFRAVWDGEKTPAEAQAETVRLWGEWLAANNK
ncbi:MAG: ABC transporter substrate-binding protein [Spirochaetales bacterium]|nr:ABC transporter substrate-binding protein [Spirochaetales bacterium]